eukprot:TRINITY_DN90502_c0_g1_i1.p1 TRINITY_DN90502_c0_g1~~TRINITY_DN90502_c0_g1_i1.p1  ORF type:complete len:199 (+),score=46.30 TRINITY_DN90502_c0_g1_i1:153-749(+)
MHNFAANNHAFQKQLAKEKRARTRANYAYYGAKGSAEIMAPKVPPAPTVEEVSKAMFDKMYKSGSMPALGAAAAQQPSSGLRSSRSQRARRPLGSASHGLAPEMTGSSFGPGTSRPASNGAGLLFFNDSRRERTPSIRSSASAYSGTSSLWLQVEKAVQEEVAKVVKPLQEQLATEEQARKRAEEALQRIQEEAASPT